MSITIYPSQFNMREDGGYEQLPAIKGETGEQGVPGVGALPGGTAGQVPVKQSGTDYDVAWEDIGWAKLWENASPTSSMSANKIPIDLSSYSEIRILVKSSASGSTVLCYEAPNAVGTNISAEIFGGSTSGDVYIYRRQLDILADGIYVNDGTGKKVTVNTAAPTVNSICIPWGIYAR